MPTPEKMPPPSNFLQLYHHLSQPKYDKVYLSLLLVFELLLSITILYKIPYTEIDWVAYMQEVSTYQGGELDYMKIKGNTGPLVYPAGFLYLFSFFKWIAGGEFGDSNGVANISTDIFRAQQIFVGLYMVNSMVVLSIYNVVLGRQRERVVKKLKEKLNYNGSNGKVPSSSSSSSLLNSSTASYVEKTSSSSSSSSNHQHNNNENNDITTQTKIANTIWSWRISMLLLCLSKRIHSIFILRLFNDGPCMLLFYISLYLFIQSKFKWGCFFFSLSVSIKMNVLLFAPGLLLVLLQWNDGLWGTVECLSICAIVQVVLGAPFLWTFPVSYIRKAFEFDRIFFFKWTVNWKFLHEDVFVSKPLSILLLSFHILTLIFFAQKWIQTARRRHHNKALFLGPRLRETYIIYTLFISNFVGIVFARTLHYQFYSWYFHSMPLLLWMTELPLLSKIAVMGLMEYSFNVFPATSMSSALLQFAHYVTLISLWKARIPTIIPKEDEAKKVL